MKPSEDSLDPQLELFFSSLRGEAQRAPQAVQRGRSNFLAQARTLTRPVSKTDDRRLTRWKASITNFFRHKEYSPMYATIASFILIFALMFGGTGATVLAAQDSLPNQYLYQLKTFSEDLALRSTLRNSDRLQLELEYAERRVAEMTRLRAMNMAVPETAYQRLEMHLDQALHISTRAADAEMIRVLNQVRERLQAQIDALPPELDHDPLLLRIREMIQTRLSWAELGVEQPQVFREQAQTRTRFEQQAQDEQRYGPGPGPDIEPQPAEQGFGPGPNDTAPGDGQCQMEDCEPQAENSFGPGPQAGEGPGPEQPSSGAEGPGSDQSPSGDESPGPGPSGNQGADSGNMEQNSNSGSVQSGQNDPNSGSGGKP
jgi:hypothetical protein